MNVEPWYKVVEPRREIKEGRSFNPDEFAIHLEQVVARTAPEDADLFQALQDLRLEEKIRIETR